ncbi:GNAT family N-acetyltransferase [Endozoicomonadaceae bacterium StTr2]
MSDAVITERLHLRPFTVADALRVQQLAGDKKVAEMTANIPHPYPDGMAESWISHHSEMVTAGKALIYAITLKDSGELIGTTGLQLDDNNGAELGYWIGVAYWGNGYCTEAVLALIKQGFSRLPLMTIYARHLADNIASGRVIKKCGFHYQATQDEFLKGSPRQICHYELKRPA